jgi:ribosomal protein S18 acetylase RimI-like enzyme
MLSVRHTTDPALALRSVGDFLATRPIEHNVHLTILHARIREPVDGRYWWLEHDNTTIAYAFQSPHSFSLGTTSMDRETTEALVTAIGPVAPDLPGVVGDATTAATFAASWAERMHVPAYPEEGQRIYRLGTPVPPRDVPGSLRAAERVDRDILVRWTEGFDRDTNTGDGSNHEEEVDRRLRDGRLVVWDVGEPVTMAMTRTPALGVARVAGVYTPPEHRRRGYASACVAALSARVLAADADTCILYTQLGNPTSNAIYRAIGYEPVAEVVRYRFSVRA